MSTESNELHTTTTEDSTIVLNKPCEFCKVLEFDDASYGGETKIKENGELFLDFGKFLETKQDRIITSGLRRAKAIKAMSYAMQNSNPDAPKMVANTELGLAYTRSDELPDLPGLGNTASAGCVFCKVLQSDLREAWTMIEKNWEDEEEVERDEEDKKQEEEATMEQEEGEDADAEEDKGDEDDEDRGGESDEEEEKGGEEDEEDEGGKEDGDCGKAITVQENRPELNYNSEENDESSDFTSAVESNAFDTDDDEQEDTTVETLDEKKEEVSEVEQRGNEEEKVDEQEVEATEQSQPQVATTELRPSKAELVITEMTYKLRDYGPHGDHAQRTWLDALYIFFTIEYMGKKRRYSIHYNIYAEESDPCASWIEIKRRPFMSDQLSPASLKKMRKLIQASEKERPVKVTEESFLPTRLLDVQAACPSGLRLVITATDPEIFKLDASRRQYAALSYCWGSGDAALKQLKTTKDVLNDHLAEVPMEMVPQTVADSIRVCRVLGIRFLWVDALCIIQGDKEDWSKESFKMSDIYTNSYIALCIVQGDSCSSGFLHKDYNPANVRIKFQSKLDSSVSGNITLRMLHPPSETFRRYTKQDSKYGPTDDGPGNSDLGSAWSTRGWTFQEDQLAPRNVFFGNLTFHVSRGSELESADGSIVGHFRFIETMDSLQRALGTWYSMIDSYSRRNLSYEHDKFPAIAALAKSFSQTFKDQTYLAGLWESDIHKGLLWSTVAWMEFDDYQKLVSEKYTAPSWSWARRPLQAYWILSADKHTKSELIVRSSEIATEEHNKYGRISTGRLRLTARMFKPPTRRNGKIRIKHSYKYWKYMNSPSFSYMLWSKSNKYMAKIRFDWDSHSCISDNAYPRGPMNDIALVLTASIFPEDDPMLKSRDLPDDQEMLLGIVVIPSSQEEGAYEKVGVFFTEDRGKGGRKFWTDVPMQDLVLV
ncbi:hypothetical protein FLONG3_10650 [Fusarium longipes]|uniref:Heterokaryon incompatibility domain-containing protein n=1 Tax=Fusarium longipes TaxID=694270 RepID=A0A395RLY2_9HYPO|nr:hypothetical protein FLONG3_10650 [Fusarium longipes]